MSRFLVALAATAVLIVGVSQIQLSGQETVPVPPRGLQQAERPRLFSVMEKPTEVRKTTASASQDTPLTITEAGYFVTVVGTDGTPGFSRLVNVTDLRGNAPEDEPEDNLSVTVKGWVDSINDPQGAQAIAIVYSHLRGTLTDGTLTPANIWNPLKKATDSALDVVQARGDWDAFRSQVAEVITEAQQRGQLQTPKQVATLLLSVQHGIELSADGNQPLSLDILVEVARRTNEAIDDAN